MSPAALLADPEGLEVIMAVVADRQREADRGDLAQRLAAGERGLRG
jgi:hypothetical protein